MFRDVFTLFCALSFVTGYFAYAAFRWRYRAESAEAELRRLNPRPASELEVQLALTKSELDFYKAQLTREAHDANAALWEREIETLDFGD